MSPTPTTTPRSPTRRPGSSPPSRAPGDEHKRVLGFSGEALGFFFIALVCVIWIAASFLVERLEAHGLSPVLLTYVCSSGFITLVPLRFGAIVDGVRGSGRGGAWKRWLVSRRRSSEADGAKTDDDDDDDAYEDDDDWEGERRVGTSTGINPGAAVKRTAVGGGEIEMTSLGERADANANAASTTNADLERGVGSPSSERRTGGGGGHGGTVVAVPPYSFDYHARAAIAVAPIWVLAQLAFNYSLLMTSVTANSMLSSSSAVFTFCVSVYMGLDKFTWMKVAAVTAYVCGTVLVTMADRDPRGVNFDSASEADSTNNALGQNIESPMFGNVLALAAAGLYALYTSVMKLHLKDDDRTDMTLFFALMGVVNFTAFGAALVALRFVGFLPELLSNLSTRVFLLACSKAFFDNVCSDYLWARAVLLTSPTVASIGLSLQIPLAASVEVFVGSPPWAAHFKNAALMASGTLFVLAGFAGVS
jgi:solute carrier family 35 protein F5